MKNRNNKNKNNKLLGLIRKLNLKTKLILIYFLTIIVPLAFIGEIILTISGNKIISQTIEISQESSKQVGRNINELLKEYITMSDRICYDDMLKNYLHPSREYKDVIDSINAYDSYLKPIVKYDFILKSEYAILKIYYLNKTLIQDLNNYFYIDETVKTGDEYKKALEANGLMAWVYNEQYILLCRSINDTISNALIGVVSVGIPESRLFNLINESESSGKLIMIAGINGQVISSNDRTLVGKSVGGEKYFNELKKNNTGILEYIDNTHYKVIYDTIDGGANFPQWKLITFIPLNNLLAEEKRIKTIGILVCVLCLIISFAAFLFFLDRITKRVEMLIKKMQGVKEGRFSIIASDKSSDEIGALTENYNLMVESLQRLIYENYEANLKMKDITIKKHEAELYALESQINPHFLFNTLESIRMGSHIKGDNETAAVILNLSGIMRRNLNWQGEIIALSNEIELIKNYLSIQRYRYKDKINYEVDVPDEVLNCKIPKLTIQPFVENAIKHGIENKCGKGFVKISAINRNDKLIITVTDDGAGINEIALAKIREELSETSEFKKIGSIGIKNVSERIRMHYGENFGLKIDSRLNEGTTVIIELPAII